MLKKHNLPLCNDAKLHLAIVKQFYGNETQYRQLNNINTFELNLSVYQTCLL